MNNIKNILFAVLLAAATSASARLEGWFLDFDDIDQKVEQQFNQMRSSMRTMGKQIKHHFNNPGVSRQISLATKDNAVYITIPNIESDAIEAHLDDAQKKLTITAPQLKVVIATRLNMIGIELTEERKVVEKDKDGDSEFVSTSVSRMDQSIARELVLEQQTIEYNQDTKQLTVIIPMKEEFKGKPVAINKVSSKK